MQESPPTAATGLNEGLWPLRGQDRQECLSYRFFSAKRSFTDSAPASLV